MKRPGITIGVTGVALALFAAGGAGGALAQTGPEHETSCTDGADEDGDGLADCGDADCYDEPECQPDGAEENSDARCSDWIDNDDDGYVDCDDNQCYGPTVSVCHGSWSGPLSGPATAPAASDGGTGDEAIPELGAGQTVEDLIGTGGDADGERNDLLCSDGIDNDLDGKTDCADFGCRFDASITVCRGNPGMRFSVVAHVAAFEYDFVADQPDTYFRKLQLRSFGPMPLIQDSFYLLSMRAEKTPRLTFALFQVPLGGGHFLNINSGGGGLSNRQVISTAKQLLLDPPWYLVSAFDQGNGAAVEVSGPVNEGGTIDYRVYVAGGSGLFSGNVGGRYFSFDNTNYTWGAGTAFNFNILGRHNRWDSEFLYQPSPLVLAIRLGAKYDQRAQERYFAGNVAAEFRWSRFTLGLENFTKRELEFESWQMAYNVRLGVLILPKHLMFGADVGEFIRGDKKTEPDHEETELRRQLNELQWRVALHWYFWRNIGIASLLYLDREVESRVNADPDRERQIRLEVQYRF